MRSLAVVAHRATNYTQKAKPSATAALVARLLQTVLLFAPLINTVEMQYKLLLFCEKELEIKMATIVHYFILPFAFEISIVPI